MVLPLGSGVEANFMPLLSLLSYYLFAADDLDAFCGLAYTLAGNVVDGGGDGGRDGQDAGGLAFDELDGVDDGIEAVGDDANDVVGLLGVDGAHVDVELVVSLDLHLGVADCLRTAGAQGCR